VLTGAGLPGEGFSALSHAGPAAAAAAGCARAGRVGVFMVPAGRFCARANSVQAYGDANRDVSSGGAFNAWAVGWLAAGAVLCCAVLCCAVLCCAVLCCAVLCCAVLCCAVLCCAVGGAPLALFRVCLCRHAAGVSRCAPHTHVCVCVCVCAPGARRWPPPTPRCT
jgi:hypothetical protein